MSISVATTTITILRPPAADAGKDPYDPKGTPDTIATGVRAVFFSPSAGRSSGGGDGEVGPTGSQEVVGWSLLADPCDLRYYDTVVDETTTNRHAVVWAKSRPDPDGDLDHVVAGVVEISGGS